ncbi:hypothetical protein [Endozoicomonas lisbonensis]|uniref:O-antigen/teichoic acid export membrane protein n=1 Tax=Endozoicomonas lisbonensis TaxID=3120522 RepID=A0ABV2SMK0_9GAMM
MKIIISSFIVLVFWVSHSNAYIDPGTGSALMSAIIGLFVAAGVVAKTFWYKITSVFNFKRAEAEAEVEDDEYIKPDDR